MKILCINKELPWIISDEFWEAVKDFIPEPKREVGKEYIRRAGGGRKPIDKRLVLTAILYKFNFDIPWKNLPKEYGASTSIHRYYKNWMIECFFQKLLDHGLVDYDEVRDILVSRDFE